MPDNLNNNSMEDHSGEIAADAGALGPPDGVKAGGTVAELAPEEQPAGGETTGTGAGTASLGQRPAGR